MHTLIFCQSYHFAFNLRIEGMTLFILHYKSNNILCNPSGDPNGEHHLFRSLMQMAYCGGAQYRKWFFIQKTNKNNPAIPTMWHRGTPEGPWKLSTSTRLLIISLQKGCLKGPGKRNNHKSEQPAPSDSGKWQNHSGKSIILRYNHATIWLMIAKAIENN